MGERAQLDQRPTRSGTAGSGRWPRPRRRSTSDTSSCSSRCCRRSPGAREPGNGAVVALSMKTGKVVWSHCAAVRQRVLAAGARAQRVPRRPGRHRVLVQDLRRSPELDLPGERRGQGRSRVRPQHDLLRRLRRSRPRRQRRQRRRGLVGRWRRHASTRRPRSRSGGYTSAARAGRCTRSGRTRGRRRGPHRPAHTSTRRRRSPTSPVSGRPCTSAPTTDTCTPTTPITGGVRWSHGGGGRIDGSATVVG